MDTPERAAAYAGLLLEANRGLNLTRHGVGRVARLHLLDSLAACRTLTTSARRR
jgi:16S rRNA G527 N7-methylase RsmG